MNEKDESKKDDEQNVGLEFLKKKVQFFFEKKTAIHIILNSGRFYNGEVKGQPSADFFLLNDYVVGEQPIFFIQIKEVEQFDTTQLPKYLGDKKDGNTDTREVKAKRH